MIWPIIFSFDNFSPQMNNCKNPEGKRFIWNFLWNVFLKRRTLPQIYKEKLKAVSQLIVPIVAGSFILGLGTNLNGKIRCR